MNFYELINLSLSELNYQLVNDWSELVKPEHRRLKNVINMVNCDICTNDDWYFLQRHTTDQIPANSAQLTISYSGRLNFIIVDGEKYSFEPNFMKFLTGKASKTSFGFHEGKILLVPQPTVRSAEIHYFTNLCAADTNGIDKAEMTNSTDKSLIPEPFVTPLIVYGAALKMKANPSHHKFSYWLTMYNNALAIFRSRSGLKADTPPQIKLKRD